MTTVLESLNAALRRALESDRTVHLLGEDILDPYGGAFKVTRGLSDSFPDRVHTTPVSEAGIVGTAAGMALRGLRPVVEIMFGDFLTLIADQLINHVAKFRYMYNDQVRVPLVIRTPMGGRRGYGPTHSQTLEKLYLGTPGLRVLAVAALDDPGELLLRAVLEDDDPVLFIENKLLYRAEILGSDPIADLAIQRSLAGEAENGNPEAGYAPTFSLSLAGAPAPQLTMVAYGYMAELAREALIRLAYEREIFAELIVPTQLAPVQVAPLVSALRRTRRLAVIEEGTLTLGWGAEIVARAAEALGSDLAAVRRVAALDQPVPAAPGLEAAALPGVMDIVQAASELAAPGRA